jgi:hypothetical protein
LNYYLYPKAKNYGLDYKFIFEYQSEDQYINLRRDSEDKARNWFFIDETNKDKTLFKDLSYGEIIEYEMGYFYHKIYKGIEDVTAFFELERPDNIIQFIKEPIISNYLNDINSILYQPLVAYQAKKEKIPILEFRYTEKTFNKHFSKLLTLFKINKIPILGLNLKLPLPEFIIRIIKIFYVFLHNVRISTKTNSDSTFILFPSPSAVNYC